MNRERVETIIRWFIATIVIIITAFLTWDGYAVAEEWQAVFVMVVGYYFTDRPQTDKARASVLSETPIPNAAALELGAQFLLALGLLIATVVFFATAKPGTTVLRSDVAGAWIGGVTLAIAFYFKSTRSTGQERSHDFLRSMLAVAVAVSTVLIFLIRRAAMTAENPLEPLPLQWIALAFIVITFYFKERSDSSPDV